MIDVLASNPNLADCSDVIITDSSVLGAVVIEEKDYDPNGWFGDSDYTYPYISGTKGTVFTGIWNVKFGAHYGTSRKTILEQKVLMNAKGPPGKTSVEFFITNDLLMRTFILLY